MLTWPAEMKPQALYLYSQGRAQRLLEAAEAGGWHVDPRPHLAFRNAGARLRLYINPTMSARDYVEGWSGPDLGRLGAHPPDTVRAELWPWLRTRRYASGEDDELLEPFLRRLGKRDAHLRPGLRLLRRWPINEVASLEERGGLVSTLRDEVNRILCSVGDPALA
jgi:O-acetyl-ADP-ribose deacetylase